MIRIPDVRAALLAVLLSGVSAALAQAQENKTITISSNSYGAIAYSPSTGKYAYVYDLRSESAAKNAALQKCGEGAELACWVNRGFCALALGSDKSCWGIGYSYGNGASTDKAKNDALADCRDRTSGAHIAVVLSSDGQHLWDSRDHTTVIDKDGNVYDGHGKLIAQGRSPQPGASSSPDKAVPGSN